MQLLDIPPTHNAMQASISFTGLTRLKKADYKARHGGFKEIVQIPSQGFILKKNDTESARRKKELSLKTKHRKALVITKAKVERRPPEYVVNKKEVSHRIKNFVNQMPGKKMLFFWTVTFPVGTSDDIAFICLNKWLTRLRAESMLKSYIWVSERQQNGTIHFHLAIHQRMDVKLANKYMRASIMHCINANQINYSRVEAMRYNGVDISKDRNKKKVTNFAEGKNQRKLISYITKYVTKNTGTFQHLAWHSSRDYSNLIIAVRLTNSEFLQVVNSGYLNEIICFEGEYYEFYTWKKEPPPELLSYLKFVNNKALALLN